MDYIQQINATRSSPFGSLTNIRAKIYVNKTRLRKQATHQQRFDHQNTTIIEASKLYIFPKYSTGSGEIWKKL